MNKAIESKKVTGNNESKKDEVRAMSNNSILSTNFSNVSDVTIFKAIGNCLKTIDRNGFMLGVYICFLNGVEIPAYNTNKGVHVPAFKRDGMTISDICNNEYVKGYSRSTISRYATAVKLIIANHDFHKFIDGNDDRRLTFTYDTVINYYQNKDIMSKNDIKSIDDALTKHSVRDIKELVKGGDSTTAKKDDTPDGNVKFTYNGNEYSISKVVMELMLKSAVKLSKSRKDK